MLFLDKILGDPNDRVIKRKLLPLVEKINSLEDDFGKKTDKELANYTQKFKDQINSGKTLDEIMPEAFAVVREAAKRVLGQRHYDVQLIGGMVLHKHGIAEMKTGEGKTLTSTLAVYLNALEEKGVHVVTVNDYLAKRDAVWMGKLYDFLGLSVSCIQHDVSFVYDISSSEKETEKGIDDSKQDANVDPGYENLREVDKKEAYLADITYGTNNEFGFDYLRDNMAASADQIVQRELNYAIVDEVDSILIDEARTPLIISAPDDRPTDMYFKYANLVKQLTENEDYNIDEKLKSATLTDKGIAKMEKLLGVENIYIEGGLEMAHHIEQALKANTLFQKDKDYVVKEGEVVIVDEFTGRMMPGRRYGEGLHQAIEAKEGVEIQRESRTLATITLQNYFRLYKKMAGMTGTGATEAEEFRKIYSLEVFVIPTNMAIARQDLADKVYKNRKGKFDALIKDIKEINAKGQPILIGTISIEQNELFANLLEKAGVRHEILNAKNHAREAEIIAQAGKKGSVTLATNMAGRGVDIVLGGADASKEEQEEIKTLGGLRVIGTERHEARRIDNQLRGRSGRQGDPGVSQFYVSMEDDLMRIFSSDKIKTLMGRLGIPDDMPIENRMVSRSIESSQKKVEGHNFDIRKHLVEYDDVINKHREAIYRKRKEIIKISPATAQAEGKGAAEGEPDSKFLRDIIFEYIEQELVQVVNLHTVGESFKSWNYTEIEQTFKTIVPVKEVEGDGHELNLEKLTSGEQAGDKGQDAKMRTKLIDHLLDLAKRYYTDLTLEVGGNEQLEKLERAVLLNAIDTLWMDHLDAIDNLRTAVGLRGYGQRDPLVEYKREAYRLFQELQAAIQNQVVYSVYKVFLHRQTQASSLMQKMLSRLSGVRFSAPAKTMSEKSESPAAASPASSGTVVGSNNIAQVEAAPVNRFDGKKVGRNDPCPCGSGKKFKKCHGK